MVYVINPHSLMIHWLHQSRPLKKEKPLIAQFKAGGLDRGEFYIVFRLVWERKRAFHCQLCVVFIPQQFREVRLNPFFLVCYSLNKISSRRQIMKSVLMHRAFWGRWLGSWKTVRFLFFLFSLYAFSQHRENIKQSKAIIGPSELQKNNRRCHCGEGLYGLSEGG